MKITQRLKGETKREYALRTLKENIISLELVPGGMVSEGELAAGLGISRGPVREALSELARVRIVETLPQLGNIIAPIDYVLVDEAHFMRETLEVAVMERCCENGLSAENLAALRENVELQQFYLESQNRSKLLQLDDEFHRQFFVGERLLEIYNLMDSMLVHFSRVRAMSLTAVREIKIVDDHRKILAALEQRDAETAKRLMHIHLTRYVVDKEAIRNSYPEMFAPDEQI